MAQALAAAVADRLRAGIEARGEASLAVSGGSTPARLFEVLRDADLEWRGVAVTPVDERWVAESSERSNARLVRERLLQGAAGRARFVSLHIDAPTPEDGRARVREEIAAVPRPFDAAVLGMGTDGHTASFFPGGDRLAEALDPDGAEPVIAMRAPGAGEPRITWSLPVLLASRALFLHVEGEDKRRVLETALDEGPEHDMPVRAVLRSGAPVDIYWAP